MNHRDHHRDAEYFEHHLSSVRRGIETSRRSDHATHIFQGFNGRLNVVSSLYSMGAQYDELRTEVEKLYAPLPEGFGGISPTLASAIPLVALGYLFDVPDRRERLYDYLVMPAGNSPRSRIVDLFLGDENAWDPDNYQGRDIPKSISKYFWPTANAARAGSADAADLLVSFVRTHWYRSWRSAGWWGTHENTVHDAYSGYWCYEGAALAKMFDLDDSALRDHKYYPYDLVHH